MPVPSDIQILINDVDLTDSVIYSKSRFDAQANAGVGTFEMVLRDPDRTLSFTTGDEVEVLLDEKRYFAGWIMQHGYTFAFPVVDTTTLANVTARQHVLRGVNYNVLFDRLTTHNEDDHFNHLPIEAPGAIAGELVRDLWHTYIDTPAGFDLDSFVDDIGVADPEGEFIWRQQGTTPRDQMEWVSVKNAAIYYFDAAKNLHYHSPETVFARWGFSDRPNNATVASSATTFTGATYGFRELDTDEDIAGLVNDVFVWGGSEFEEEGATVFARSQNPTSIASHGRWQKAEVLFGDSRAGNQAQVNAIANAIAQGPGDPYVTPGTDEAGMVRNRSVPAWNVRLAWYAHDVPTMTGSGLKDHLTPGDIVTIVLWVHGQGPTKPLILTLPLRQVSISFPTLPTEGGAKTYVRFDGTFSLSVDDPVTLWESILRRRTPVRNRVISTTGPTGTPVPGAQWQGAPNETPNGTTTVFTLMTSGSPIRYAGGTSEVYLNGLRLRQGADYSEQASAGKITLFDAPAAGSTLWVFVRLGT